MIYFEPKAGLCNRIKGIASAYKIAKELNESLTIIWMNNQECNCPLDKLFILPSDIQIKNIPYIPSIRLCSYVDRMFRYSYIRNCKYSILDDEIYQEIEDIKAKIKGNNVYIHTAANWYAGEEALSIFRLSDACKAMVDFVKAKFHSPVIGVHLRRTDNETSIKESTTEDFVACMNQEMAKDPAVCFYVASDSSQDKAYLIEKFGEHVIQSDNIMLSRNQEKGIMAAVAELYLLASTDKIYGSKGSSYSHTASQIYGIPYVTVTKEMAGLED